MNDTRAGAPETNVVLGSSSAQEVVNLLVKVLGTGQILGATNLSLNQMITVDGSGGGNLGHTSRHELENSHLSGSILASNTVRSELKVRNTTLNVLLMGLVEMSVKDLLGVGQGSAKSLLDDVDVLKVLLVVDEGVLLPDVLVNLRVASDLRLGGGRESSSRRANALVKS